MRESLNPISLILLKRKTVIGHGFLSGCIQQNKIPLLSFNRPLKLLFFYCSWNFQLEKKCFQMKSLWYIRLRNSWLFPIFDVFRKSFDLMNYYGHT